MAPEGGYLSAIDGEALGLAVVDLGGGRRVETDKIDPAVGLTDVISLGAQVTKGQPLATVHARDEASAEAAAQAVLAALTIGDAAPEAMPLIRSRVG
jgi:thymidine phosphorylase